jgi:hypothetical protein
VTGTVTESNREPPLESAMSRGNDKSVGMGASLNYCAKAPRQVEMRCKAIVKLLCVFARTVAMSQTTPLTTHRINSSA